MSIVNTPLFERILARSPFSEHELVVLVATASSRYKSHYIEKRNGRGLRLISQPTKEVKFLQRLLVTHELGRLPIHDAATAYRSGRSILQHAEPHAAARYLLKLDFTDFFPSLKRSALNHRLSIDTEYSPLERWTLASILCRQVPKTEIFQLSIGAPSSPFVSNYLLHEFDSRMTDYCRQRAVIYTRYADDLAFSTSRASELDRVELEVRRVLSEMSYLGLSLNESKTVNVSTKRRRSLVGLVLSNDGQVSIGRDAKRKLRAAMSKLAKGELSSVEISRLRGMLAFTHGIDPEFVRQQCDRYGFATLQEVDAPGDDA